MGKWISRWIIIAIAVPIVAAILRGSADAVEKKRGPGSKTAKGLRFIGDTVKTAR